MVSDSPSSAEYLQMLVNNPSYQDLIVLGHEIDDEGQTAGSYEYAMRPLRAIQNSTRIAIDEKLGVLPWTLPDNVGSTANAKYLGAIEEYSVESVERMKKAAIRAIRENKKILSLGGNHLRATELLGLLKACHELGIEVGIVWTDAHPDQNTPEISETHNVHGMVAALAMGHGAKELLKLLKDAPFLKPENIVYVGINAPEKQENDRLIAMGIRCVTMQEIDDNGSMTVAYDAINEMQKRMGETGVIWHELDADVLADSASEGKVMPNRNGMTEKQLHSLCTWMGANLNMLGCGVSEIAPAKDPDGKMAEIVASSVAAMLKVPNVNFAEHMKKNRADHPNNESETEKGAAQQAVIEPLKKNPIDRKSRNRVLDFLAGAAAAIGALVGAKMYVEQQRPEIASAEVYRVPLGKNHDRGYAFTGISTENPFTPPGFERKSMYSVERLKESIQAYKTTPIKSRSTFDYTKRQLYSILYLGELRADAVPMWKEVKDSFPEQEYATLMKGYQTFRASIGQPEQREIDEYLKSYDHPHI